MFRCIVTLQLSSSSRYHYVGFLNRLYLEKLIFLTHIIHTELIQDPKTFTSVFLMDGHHNISGSLTLYFPDLQEIFEIHLFDTTTKAIRWLPLFS